MRLFDLEMIHHRQDIVGGNVLRIALGSPVHRTRIATRAVGDAAISLTKMTHLHFPAAMVRREFMDENDRHALARLLVIKLHAVGGLGERH